MVQLNDHTAAPSYINLTWNAVPSPRESALKQAGGTQVSKISRFARMPTCKEPGRSVWAPLNTHSERHMALFQVGSTRGWLATPACTTARIVRKMDNRNTSPTQNAVDDDMAPSKAGKLPLERRPEKHIQRKHGEESEKKDRKREKEGRNLVLQVLER